MQLSANSISMDLSYSWSKPSTIPLSLCFSSSLNHYCSSAGNVGNGFDRFTRPTGSFSLNYYRSTCCDVWTLPTDQFP